MPLSTSTLVTLATEKDLALTTTRNRSGLPSESQSSVTAKCTVKTPCPTCFSVAVVVVAAAAGVMMATTR